MELQHVNVKLLIQKPEGVNLEALVPVFHHWIQEQVFEERLLDVADYRHVPDGPGVILLGIEGDYSVDNTGGRLSVRYNRKTGFAGSNADRLQQATRAALSACQRLEAEASLQEKLRFNGQDVEVFINDRMLAPNHEKTRTAAELELRAFFTRLFGGAEYSLSYPEDSRRLFGVSAKASRVFSIADLLKNLSV